MMLILALVSLRTLHTSGDHIVVDCSPDYFTAEIVVDDPKKPCSSFSSPIYTFVDRVKYDGKVIGETSVGRFSYVNIHRFYTELRFAELRIEDELVVKHIYLEFFDGERKELSEREFWLKTQKFFVRFTFDLSDPVVPDMFTKKKYQPFGTPSLIFTPRRKYRILRVVDGENEIWESSDTEYCTCIIVHIYGGINSFIQLLINIKEQYKALYFESKEYSWREIPKDDFYNKLEIASGPAARF
ncbi:signal peptide-containing protein [Theileria equi strain WA]|uniref:Signal peptide-containing protein n=1 Tax=Theileria equi strain WA TaxID=1537102 RepID=L0AY79_THEEQ|nr:signal peptide-containing protein [Theileria equi strain WA]AFZ79956.1 signal peptide-containing protein [Theileria equi strain WA]|eukprot:XP_004829622.1 signal peptide-containing protein [Theileria equi strain WA]